jgi:hypothetical protein
VDDFRAALPRMSCVEVSGYLSLDEGQRFGLVAWADVESAPAIYLAWEWCEIYGNAVGMRDPTAVSTNVQLVDHLGRQIGRVKFQIELASAVHSWEWWTKVDPAHLCRGATDPSPE